MIIDVNAYLGHFAFRQLRHNTADQLLRLMDAKSIDKAIVSSASAITYRNAQSGNEEVAAEVRPHRDRLIPFAVINPFYAGWKDDVRICQNEFGMPGLRLYPKWHNYALSDACCRELMAVASQQKLLVSIPVRAEDSRQRSWLADIPDVPLTEVAELVKAHPKVSFLILNGTGYSGSPLGRKAAEMPHNYVLELSRLRALLENDIGQLLRNLGPERVVFGTGMPFNAPDPSLVKLEVLDAPEEVKENIRWRNAAQLLGI